jgi:hypothetical protein
VRVKGGGWRITGHNELGLLFCSFQFYYVLEIIKSTVMLHGGHAKGSTGLQREMLRVLWRICSPALLLAPGRCNGLK